jgi:uncharacterized membrane protein YhaH (DUF805 family)
MCYRGYASRTHFSMFLCFVLAVVQALVLRAAVVKSQIQVKSVSSSSINISRVLSVSMTILFITWCLQLHREYRISSRMPENRRP